MNVVLLDNIQNLGQIGDQVAVKAGFARNFLLPQGKAVLATKANLVDFEQRRAEFEKAAKTVLAQAQARAETLNGLAVTVSAQASDEGKLFGSVGPREIVNAVVTAGQKIAKREVVLPEGPLRTVGDHEVDLQLHNEVVAKIKVAVVAA